MKVLKNTKFLLVLLVLSLLAFNPFLPVTAQEELPLRVKQPKEITFPAYVEDEVIVKFKAGIAEEQIEKLNKEHGVAVIRTSRFKKFRTLKIPERRGVYEMVEIYGRSPLVEYAEPNFFAFATLVPNDPHYLYQWHFDDDNTNNPGEATSNPYGGVNGGGIGMEPAWDISTGDSSIVVAVLDTGAAYENYEDPEDALCYDRFGRLKTCRPAINTYYQAPDLANTNFVAGYDFINGDNHPNDDEGHGTHVTGTVAQSTNNNLGVAGIAFNTTIMPVKVLDANGTGTFDDVADGIYFATDNGAKIINLSLSSSSSSTTLEDAVAYAYSQGVTVVAAGGNAYEEGNPPQYPAAYDAYVVAVGATRYDETRSYYSNTGSYIDLVAPGGDVTVDQNEDTYGDGVLQQTFDADPSDFGYWFYQGTSMSTPHVSGVAALILALKPGFTPDQVRNTLQSAAEDKGGAGKDDEYGWGIVDAYAALSGLVPSVSISLTTDGAVEFGILALGATADTSGDVQTVKVDVGPANLEIKSTVFADNGNTWSLGVISGPDQVVWEYSPDASAWTIFEAADTLYLLASNVATEATQDIYFRLTIPTETSSSDQYSTTVTIVATAP